MTQRPGPETTSDATSPCAPTDPPLTPTELRGLAVRGGLVIVLSRAASQIMRLGVTVLLARILSPDDFGLVAVVLAIIGIGGLLQDLGLSAATIQRATITQAQISAMFWINAAVGLTATLAGVALSPTIAWFYQRPELANLAAALSLTFAMSGLCVQHNALLQREMRFADKARIGLTSTAISGIASVVLALRGAGAWALVAQSLIGSALSMLLIWRVSEFRPTAFRWSRDAREMTGFGARFLAFRTLGYAAHNLQVVLIGRELGMASAALFTRGYFLSRQALGYANDTGSQLANSTLPRLVGEPARLRSLYLRCLNVMFLVTAPIAAACGFFGDDIIALLFGAKWRTSGEVLKVMGLGMTLQPLLFSTGWIYFAYGNMNGLVRWGAFGWLVMIAASVVGLQWGVIGVAWGWSLGIVALCLPCCHYAFVGRPVSIADALRTVWPPLAAALAAAVAAMFAARVIPLDSVYLRMPLIAAVMSACYLALLIWPLGQRALILEVLRSARRRPGVKAPRVVPGADRAVTPQPTEQA